MPVSFLNDARSAAMAVVGGVFSEIKLIVVPLACFQAASSAMDWANAVRREPVPSAVTAAALPTPFKTFRRVYCLTIVVSSSLLPLELDLQLDVSRLAASGPLEGSHTVVECKRIGNQRFE